ncbi:hypothetical protein [Limnovirga soli]|uniref:Uncharacterized protein n=1 Tax=Limnovirga soli TaxID=2656915 RepID=A0A8J8JSN7_9BACT|nr:hypothetical protein [Limnovirga soli]NNV54948.1 hypothetical protein [Limnovirga soli]
MAYKFDVFAKAAAKMADDKFTIQFSSLTSLNDDEVEAIIKDSGISKADLAKVLAEVKDATNNNQAKAAAINKINGGISALVGIAAKFL